MILEIELDNAQSGGPNVGIHVDGKYIGAIHLQHRGDAIEDCRGVIAFATPDKEYMTPQDFPVSDGLLLYYLDTETGEEIQPEWRPGDNGPVKGPVNGPAFSPRKKIE